MMNPAFTKRIKVVSTVLIFSALVLQAWSLVASLPQFLQTISSITQIVLLIHALEGIVAAILIFLYRQRAKNNPAHQTNSMLIDHLPESTLPAVIKAGLYAFFVGTVGFSEIVKATQKEPEQRV